MCGVGVSNWLSATVCNVTTGCLLCLFPSSAHPGLPRIVRNENSANPLVHSNPPHPLMPEAGSDHHGDI